MQQVLFIKSHNFLWHQHLVTCDVFIGDVVIAGREYHVLLKIHNDVDPPPPNYDTDPGGGELKRKKGNIYT